MSIRRYCANSSYKMFEVNIDEYLDEETESVKRVLDGICKTWGEQVRPGGTSLMLARHIHGRDIAQRADLSQCVEP